MAMYVSMFPESPLSVFHPPDVLPSEQSLGISPKPKSAQMSQQQSQDVLIQPTGHLFVWSCDDRTGKMNGHERYGIVHAQYPTTAKRTVCRVNGRIHTLRE